MGAKKLAVMQFAKMFIILLMLVVIVEGVRIAEEQCEHDTKCYSPDDCPSGEVCCPWEISRCPDGAGSCGKNCA
ncbi:hypothetical protein SUGI_1116750 [Cryptomeria japonica]|nr:hypothetical protein SUGI_1116750 [Cryptomeria japonica]